MGSQTHSKKSVLRRLLPVLMAFVMVFTAGVLPGGESHAAVNSATIPAAYRTGYMTYKCIDISNWQGVLSVSQFKALKAKGISQVIVRVGYTSQSLFWRHGDNSYKGNINNAYKAGLKVGAYYYSQAKSVKEAQKEADTTIALLKPYKSKISLPVAFDWEWGKRLNSSWAAKNGKANNTKICQAYCEKIRKAGYTPMVYASCSVLIRYLNRDTLHSKYKIWMAHYTGGKATDYGRPMYMWQFSSTAQFGKNLTNTKNVDINYVFVKLNGKWVKVNGRYRYRIGKSYLRNQWITLSGRRYYLDASGYRVTGYRKIGSYYYGFASDGTMYKNRVAKIGGKTYKFLANGRSVLYIGRVNVNDYLSFKTGPGINYRKVGQYTRGRLLNIVRVSGNWAQAENGYWSCIRDSKKAYIIKVAGYPR